MSSSSSSAEPDEIIKTNVRKVVEATESAVIETIKHKRKYQTPKLGI